MSAHSSHSSGNSLFSAAKNWFSTKSPSYLNPLSATNAIGHNIVTGVVKNTTGYIADVLNPLWTGIKNAGSLIRPSKYKEHGFFKNIGKSATGIVAHTLDAVNNLIPGGALRGLDHFYTNAITNSVVDAASGTTDRVPGVGKFTGNIVKGATAVPAAPLRLLARIWEKTIDKGIDWIKGFSAESGKGRHLTTSNIGHQNHEGHH